jgi:hypothetical protein
MGRRDQSCGGEKSPRNAYGRQSGDLSHGRREAGGGPWHRGFHRREESKDPASGDLRRQVFGTDRRSKGNQSELNILWLSAGTARTPLRGSLERRAIPISNGRGIDPYGRVRAAKLFTRKLRSGWPPFCGGRQCVTLSTYAEICELKFSLKIQTGGLWRR